MFGHHPKFYHEYDLLNHMYDITDEDGCILTVLDEDTLKSIPHVETPITHAHWKCNGAWSMAKQCSNCSFVYKGETDYMGYVHYQASNYCPNCGAKMDEEAQV